MSVAVATVGDKPHGLRGAHTSPLVGANLGLPSPASAWLIVWLTGPAGATNSRPGRFLAPG